MSVSLPKNAAYSVSEYVFDHSSFFVFLASGTASLTEISTEPGSPVRRESTHRAVGLALVLQLVTERDLAPGWYAGRHSSSLCRAQSSSHLDHTWP
jgi:hypothetical protein